MNATWQEECPSCRPPTADITDPHGRRWALSVRHLDGLTAYARWLRAAPGYALDDDLAARYAAAQRAAARVAAPPAAALAA